MSWGRERCLTSKHTTPLGNRAGLLQKKRVNKTYIKKLWGSKQPGHPAPKFWLP